MERAEARFLFQNISLIVPSPSAEGYGGVQRNIMKNDNNTIVKTFGLLIGFLAFVFLMIFDISPENIMASKMAAVAALMAIWWITEAIPLGATALLPIVLMPVLGIMKTGSAASQYFSSISFLFLGGFIIAIAMEKWMLHKRISLKIIRSIGGGTKGLIMGFMIASAFMSMFISNTATTIMMLPIALSIIYKLENKYSEKKVHAFSLALLLGIAYSSSIGGVATLVGTAPNLVFIEIYNKSFPNAAEISFGSWMMMGVPLAGIMIAILWALITKVLIKLPKTISIGRSEVEDEYQKLGTMSFEEKAVMFVFALTALLWIFRKDLDFGMFSVPGWSGIFANSSFLNDGTIAIFTSLLLFIIPSKNKPGRRILDYKAFTKIPWEIMILFGGGFALAGGFRESGLSEIIGSSFSGLSEVHVILLILAICFVITFLTELTSNTATTQTILPILASISVAMDINSIMLMVPATISASFAFMLPVATPPNAIIFGSKRIKISEMVKTGLVINFIGAIVITLVFYFFGADILGK